MMHRLLTLASLAALWEARRQVSSCGQTRGRPLNQTSAGPLPVLRLPSIHSRIFAFSPADLPLRRFFFCFFFGRCSFPLAVVAAAVVTAVVVAIAAASVAVAVDVAAVAVAARFLFAVVSSRCCTAAASAVPPLPPRARPYPRQLVAGTTHPLCPTYLYLQL